MKQQFDLFGTGEVREPEAKVRPVPKDRVQGAQDEIEMVRRLEERRPNVAIPADITRLTGITDDMVAGQTIDIVQVRALIEPADLIIAHNAGFDRPFCETFSPAFAPKA